MSTEAIRAELIRRWRERVCDGNPDGAAVGDGAALLFMEMVMDAQELLTRSTFDRFTSIAQACNVVTSAAGMANRAPAVPSPTPKLLTTEAGAASWSTKTVGEIAGLYQEAASQLLDAGLGDDAPLRVHVLDLAAKWSALAGDGRGKREGVYASCAMDLRRLVNRAPAVTPPTPKPLTTEARAVLVAWLPGYDDPIAWWATDDREAFLDALVSCAIDQRRAQTDPADEQPTDHEISRDFRAAVRIEAVKP